MKKIFLIIQRLIGLFLFFLKGGEACAKYLGVKVGKDCRIYTNKFGVEPFLITIGDRVTITSGVRFITHDGSLWLITDEKGRRYKYKQIKICNDVFIGVNSILLPGVTVGEKCIIGAGSVVTKSIPLNSIVAGVPARVIGKYDDFESYAKRFYPADKDLPSKTMTNYKEWVFLCIEMQDKLHDKK